MATGQIFSKTTQALFYNYKQLPIQRMLDFDFLCGIYSPYHWFKKDYIVFCFACSLSTLHCFIGRETPSVAGIINPGSDGFQKLFFGQEEIAIPVHPTWVICSFIYIV
jgi:ATP citrate (pro-S)-lyase